MVWGTDDMFFQITVVPTLIVIAAGLKPKLPFFALMISTTTVEPAIGVCLGVGVALLAVAAGVLALVVGVDVGLEPVVLPPPLPQAASTIVRLTTTAIKENRVGMP